MPCCFINLSLLATKHAVLQLLDPIIEPALRDNSIPGCRVGVPPSETLVFAPPATHPQITAAEASKCILEREGHAGVGRAMI